MVIICCYLLMLPTYALKETGYFFWRLRLHINEYLSHDTASRSDITLCNKIDKPLVVYRFRYVR